MMHTDDLGRTYPRAEIIVTEPGTYVDRSLPTASAWNQYTILPGTYPITYVTTSWTPWNPDAKVTAGFTANVGPTYAIARVRAVLTRSHYENRLLSEVRAKDTEHNTETTVTAHMYSYEVEKSRGTVRTVLDGTGVLHLLD